MPNNHTHIHIQKSIGYLNPPTLYLLPKPITTSINLIGRYSAPKPDHHHQTVPPPSSGNDVICYVGPDTWCQRAITARVVPGSRWFLTPLEPNIHDLECGLFLRMICAVVRGGGGVRMTTLEWIVMGSFCRSWRGMVCLVP